MKISLKDNTLTIVLTDEEKEKFLKYGLSRLLDGDFDKNPYVFEWKNYPGYSVSPVNDKKPTVYDYTYTCDTDNKYPCNCDWPWKDKDGHMLGGAQMDSPSKFPCEAGDLVKKHKK